jgi:hypothetical protein
MELSTATHHMLAVLGPASAIDDKAGDHGD